MKCSASPDYLNYLQHLTAPNSFEMMHVKLAGCPQWQLNQLGVPISGDLSLVHLCC
jgi:hypothetical protein